MTKPQEYSFARYLTSKKSVDDRAINRHVWANLARALTTAEVEIPLRVLELGAGVGTMIERSVGWGLLSQAAYTALDAQAGLLKEAGRRLPRWAHRVGFSVERKGEEGLVLSRGATRIQIDLEVADLLDFIERRENQGVWDLLVAHALLDLLDLPTSLPRMLACVRPGGLIYFTLNFDGHTILQPEFDPELDGLIESLYHRSMDERLRDGAPSGDSRTGRHLFHHLATAGVDLLDAGSSDWVIFPKGGRYPADEAYFLHFVINTIHQALDGIPELDRARLEAWATARHTQIESAELVYIAHQMDFLGRLPLRTS